MRFFLKHYRDRKDYSCRKTSSEAFTIIEVALALFVLMFGLLGILALFPVGLDLSRVAIESTDAAIVGQSVMEYLNVDPTVISQWPTYTQPANSIGVVTGVVDGDSNNSDDELTCTTLDGSSPGWSTTENGGNGIWDDHILMITTGPVAGKVYEITSNTANTLVCSATGTDVFSVLGDTTGDYIYSGTNFIILGKIGNTIPPNFFASSPALRTEIRVEVLSKSGNGTFPISTQSSTAYGYVCILSGRSSANSDIRRADILIYRSFNTAIRPELNRAPIKTFISYLHYTDPR